MLVVNTERKYFMRNFEMSECSCLETEQKTQRDLLDDGLSVCDVSQHHALDDAVVLFLRQVLVRDQGSVVLGCWGGVDPLQPGVALDLLQGSPSLGVPLKHTVYQTEATRRWAGRSKKKEKKHQL